MLITTPRKNVETVKTSNEKEKVCKKSVAIFVVNEIGTPQLPPQHFLFYPKNHLERGQFSGHFHLIFRYVSRGYQWPQNLLRLQPTNS